MRGAPYSRSPRAVPEFGNSGELPHYGRYTWGMTTLTGCPALDVRPAPATQVTHEGAAWLASPCPPPRGALAVWEERPAAPAVLPCGTAFDVVNVPLVLGRRMLDLLWAEGPGCGPAAVHRGRILLFTAPG